MRKCLSLRRRNTMLSKVDINHNGNLWEGNGYVRREGLLIVLESTYTDGTYDGSTCNCVRRFRNREWYDYSFTILFEHVICRPAPGKKIGTPREIAIDPLAITNIVERILRYRKPPDPKDEPTKGDFESGRLYLERRLRVLQPRVVLLLGKSFREYGQAAVDDVNREQSQPEIQSFWSYHPAYGGHSSVFYNETLPDLRRVWADVQNYRGEWGEADT
jgi:hypothetical protein